MIAILLILKQLAQQSRPCLSSWCPRVCFWLLCPSPLFMNDCIELSPTLGFPSFSAFKLALWVGLGSSDFVVISNSKKYKLLCGSGHMHACTHTQTHTHTLIYFLLLYLFSLKICWPLEISQWSLVVRTLCFHCQGHRFNPWAGN